MRIVTEEYKVYTFDTAPKEIKDKIIENFDNDGFLYEFAMQERVDTLKALANILQGDLDYSLSCVPDRGEFIRITPKHDVLYFDGLWDIINQDKECPLTGCCYDHDIIDHLSRISLLSPNTTFEHRDVTYNTNDGLKDALNLYIESIHEEYQFMLSHEYIADMCEANNYEFTENGKIY